MFSFFSGNARPNIGQASRQFDEDQFRMDMKLRRDSTLIKSKFLWVKKDIGSKEFSAPNSYYKNVQKDLYKDIHKDAFKEILRPNGRTEATSKDASRETNSKNHKHLKRLFSRKDTSAQNTHVRKKKKESDHQLKSDNDDESIQEGIVGEEGKNYNFFM